MSRRLRFSIALCTWNGEAYLGEQLRSIAEQTRPADELVIFDDASTDRTVELIRQISPTLPMPVNLCVNSTNAGVTANFDRVISACTGEVIILCDQDDVWMPEKVEVIASAFEHSESLGCFFSDAQMCDAEGGTLAYSLWDSVGFTPSLQKKLAAGKAFEVILRQNIVTGATMAFASWLRPMVQPINLHWIHDGWIALLSSAIAPVVAVPDKLTRYRQHATQSVGATRRSLIQQYRNARGMDRDVFAKHADMYQAAYDRVLLWDSAAVSARSKVLALLREKIRHYRVRSSIRLRQRSRLVPTAAELLTLRYRKYSLGWKSFAQDLFL